MEKLFERIKHGDGERRSFRERRATPRLNVGLALETRDGDETMRLVTNDLSTFGLSIAGGKTPKKGTKLQLRLFLPDAPTEPLELEAEVLGALDAEGGTRMRFIDPDLALSVEVAAEHRLCAYDAYLIVCALQQRAPLLTLDADLGRAASAAGVSLQELSA